MLGSATTTGLQSDVDQQLHPGGQLADMIPDSLNGKQILLDIRGPGTQERILGLASLLFAISNNRDLDGVSSNQLDKEVLWFFRQVLASQGLAKSLLQFGSFTARAIAEQIFASAMRLSDTDVVAMLLQQKFDRSVAVELKYWSFTLKNGLRRLRLPHGDSFATPLQMAYFEGNLRLVHLLIQHGARHNWYVGSEHTSLLSCAVASFATNPGNGPRLLKLVLSAEDVKEREWLSALKLGIQIGSVDALRILLMTMRGFSISVTLQAAALNAAIVSRQHDLVEYFSSAQLCAHLDNRQHLASFIKPLWSAVHMRDCQAAKMLLERGVCAEAAINALPSPLQFAAFVGDLRLAELLLEFGADVNRRFLDRTVLLTPQDERTVNRVGMGRTALGAALIGRRSEVVSLLLRKGAWVFDDEIRVAKETGLAYLLESHSGTELATQGQKNIPNRFLLVSGSELTAARQEESGSLPPRAACTPVYDSSALCAAVHMAVRTRHDSDVHVLLKQRSEGPPSGHGDVLEGTALAISIYRGDVSLARVILSGGIRPPSAYFPGDIDDLRRCPTDLARFSVQQWDQKSGWWKRGGLKMSPLTVAVRAANQAAVQLLLDHSYKPDRSAFIHAAIQSAAILELLLPHHVDFSSNGQPVRYEELLVAAIQVSNKDVVRLLMHLVPDVNAMVSVRQTATTPLTAALGLGDTEVRKIVLGGLAVVGNDAPDVSGGKTALQQAAADGSISSVRRLVALGADVNARGPRRYGRTALEAAAEHGRLDTVALLLHSGVQTTGLGLRQYIRATKFAVRHGHYALADMLRGHREWTELDLFFYKLETLQDVDHTVYKQAQSETEEETEETEDSDEDIGVEELSDDEEDEDRDEETTENKQGTIQEVQNCDVQKPDDRTEQTHLRETSANPTKACDELLSLALCPSEGSPAETATNNVAQTEQGQTAREEDWFSLYIDYS